MQGRLRIDPAEGAAHGGPHGGADKQKVTVLGIRGSAETAKGVGVGSTLAQVKAAYPDAKVEESDASMAIVFRRDGDKWLGISFSDTPDEVKDDSKMGVMEATSGEEPVAYLSGCSY